MDQRTIENLIGYYLASTERPPRSLWNLKSSKGDSLAEILVRSRRLEFDPDDPKDRKILLSRHNKYAYLQASLGYKFEDPDILRRPGVARIVVRNHFGFIPKLSSEEFYRLKLFDTYAWQEFYNKEIERLISKLDIKKQIKIARTYAEHGIKISENPEIVKNPQVAYALALKGYSFADPEIQSIRACGSTVAHAIALFGDGSVLKDPNILRKYNKAGLTPAHLLASRGYRFTDPKILSLKTKTVKCIKPMTVMETYEAAVNRAMGAVFSSI